MAKGKTTLEGLIDGVRLSSDPLGMFYTGVSDRNTLGGRGWRGLSMVGERKEDVEYETGLYKGSKIVGAIVGGAINYSLYGIPQVIALGANYISGQALKRRGYKCLPAPK